MWFSLDTVDTEFTVVFTERWAYSILTQKCQFLVGMFIPRVWQLLIPEDNFDNYDNSDFKLVPAVLQCEGLLYFKLPAYSYVLDKYNVQFEKVHKNLTK